MLDVAVSHSQLSLQPCDFWLLVISYMVAAGDNLLGVKMLLQGGIDGD